MVFKFGKLTIVKNDLYSATYGIMAINVFIAICMVITSQKLFTFPSETIVQYGALTKSSPYFNILFSIFLHGSLAHLFSNMLGLKVYGEKCEKLFGWKVFLTCYLLSGIGGAIGFLYYGEGAAVVGASGAISGLVGLRLGAYFFNNNEDDSTPLWGVSLDAVLIIAIGFLPGIALSSHAFGFLTGLIFSLLYCACLRNPVTSKLPEKL